MSNTPNSAAARARAHQAKAEADKAKALRGADNSQPGSSDIDPSMPRYRALVDCYRDSGDGLGERIITAGEEFSTWDIPGPYFDPVNQAADEMIMKHPPAEMPGPIDSLPMTYSA